MTDYGTPKMKKEEQQKVMSEAYWQLWNPEVQKKIDNDIDKNRKADGSFLIPEIKQGTEIEVEQISHAFIFGAHIFNFNQLGSDECNNRYKELYGTLFNSATIAFYWRKLEMEEGKPRFEGDYTDSAEYWNNVVEPKKERHWRRPAPDPVIEFCEKKGIRLHGHTLTWGNQKWHHPKWLTEKMPQFYRREENYPILGRTCRDMDVYYKNFTPAQIENMMPEYVQELNHKIHSRIIDIALRYKDRIQSWDIVNESAIDYGNGVMVEGDGVCKSRYGLMPGDYTYRSFKVAEGVFPQNVKFNINDFRLTDAYLNQVNNLISRNCKVDIVGAQMHLFDPQICQDIADGKELRQSPAEVWDTMNLLSETKRPIHLSEITITSPGDDLKGEAIQSVMSHNLYRLWFSIKNMMGITWWNVVDDCGAPGESSVSGLFKRDMSPKLAYYTLNNLINSEWKTITNTKAGKNGLVEFRGFKGKYLLSWYDQAGQKCSTVVDLY
jgi:endo-1,4-beta-xylanase